MKFTLAQEVDDFWKGSGRFLKSSERNIDIDDLQGIVIYLVWALKDASLLIECTMIDEFASKGTKLNVRSLFQQMLMSSIKYLLEIELDKNPQESEQAQSGLITSQFDQ